AWFLRVRLDHAGTADFFLAGTYRSGARQRARATDRCRADHPRTARLACAGNGGWSRFGRSLERWRRTGSASGVDGNLVAVDLLRVGAPVRLARSGMEVHR